MIAGEAGQAVAAEDFCRDKLQRCEQLQSYTSYLEYSPGGTGGGGGGFDD